MKNLASGLRIAVLGATTLALATVVLAQPTQAASPDETQAITAPSPAAATHSHAAPSAKSATTSDGSNAGAMTGTMHPDGTNMMQCGGMEMTQHDGMMQHDGANMMQHDGANMQHDGANMMPMRAMRGGHMASATVTQSGQDAFGAIQEIVRKLEADPSTDWSKIDLEALRQHLIDMNEVTLKADVSTSPVEGGVGIAITGSGRTLSAIQRMIPEHAREINGANGWNAKTESMRNGVRLTVTSNDSKQVARIRGLGFIGILVSGSHHQAHHLAMAKGGFVHSH